MAINRQGMETAVRFVNTHVLPHAIAIAKEKSVWEPVNSLQALLQSQTGSPPIYKCAFSRLPSAGVDRLRFVADGSLPSQMASRNLPKPRESDVFQVQLVVQDEVRRNGCSHLGRGAV
jgi:hypothetical protein